MHLYFRAVKLVLCIMDLSDHLTAISWMTVGHTMPILFLILCSLLLEVAFLQVCNLIAVAVVLVLRSIL